MSLEAHVVSHTHWDREWYHPLERFQQRLVALVDELLADPPGPHESFLLDGQAIVLEDYLAIRPERFEALGVLLREGRLEAGPWYVLADELIPSGEALIRNLLAGRRVLRRFGAESPPVLYCPDSFGHPAALPSLAAGFGLPVAILWRGYGGARWPSGDTVRWTAPSGDAVVVFHLPNDGYEYGSHLPSDPDAARARWARMRGELAARSTTGVLLVPNGADHHARQTDWRAALAAVELAGAADNVRRSSLLAFARRLAARSVEHVLPSVRGELRDSYGYTWALQGTFATRAHEKRLNAHAERALVREAEPWSALAANRGTSRRALVEHAWRTLLAAHPHDTLCGCSIDGVANTMELRLRSAVHQAHGVRDDAVVDLIGHDPVAAITARERWSPAVIVRNAAPRSRSGVAIIEIEEFVADVAVGPGSALLEGSGTSPHMPARAPVVSDLGTLQVLSRRIAHSRTESARHYPDDDLVAITRVAAWVSDAPPYGIATYPIDTGEIRRRPIQNSVSTSRRGLHNGLLAVEVDEAGRVSLEQIEDGRRIASLLAFYEEADVGDLYTPAPRPRPFHVQLRRVERVHRGPLRGELLLRYRISDGAGRRATTIADVDVHLILDANARFLRVEIVGENHGRHHRVRLGFHSDVPSAAVWADAAFGPVHREPIVVTDADRRIEQPPATAPLHRYVSLFRESEGFTLFSDGLAEYEARPDGVVLVTLVRAVGELSKNDLPERPGHAGWPAPTPRAQCLGEFAAKFACCLHGPRSPDVIDDVERTADDALLPLSGYTLRSALRPANRVHGIELTGPGLAFSAAKTSENGEAVVLRCVNLLETPVAGAWRLPWKVREASLSRIDETIISKLLFIDDVVSFQAGSREIVTIVVR